MGQSAARYWHEGQKEDRFWSCVESSAGGIKVIVLGARTEGRIQSRKET